MMVDREKLQKEITDSQKQFSQKFREMYAQLVKFDQLIDEMYISLYGKFYSKRELQDLMKFYQNPTGQKLEGHVINKEGTAITMKITPYLDGQWRNNVYSNETMAWVSNRYAEP